MTLSNVVNQHDQHKGLLEKVHSFFHSVKKGGISDVVYFPDMILMNRPMLLVMLLVKLLWLIAGGWIWRAVRHLIFSKIKANTFKSPVTVGAAMVIYPLVSFLFFISCLVFGWPLWIVPVWMLVMISGMFFRPPFLLIWKMLTLNFKIKNGLKRDVLFFKGEIESMLGQVKP